MRSLLATVALLAAVGVALAGCGSSAKKEASCTDTGDRLTKLGLMQHLTEPPHVLILGSSRARPAMPAAVKDLTGGTAFNAGVHGGTSADEYVFTRLLAQRFPQARPAYLIFTDVGIASDSVDPELANEPLARPFLGSAATSVKTACSANGEYTANGGLAYPPLSTALQEQAVANALPGVLAQIPADAKQPHHIDPAQTKWFQKLLGFINAQGATPVLVLNPIYPAILAAREKHGFPELKAANAYLAWLHKRYRFVLVNGENIHTWGGTASDFSNVDHIDRTNMSRLLEYVVQHSNGVLTR
jgi:hypothetical protein